MGMEKGGEGLSDRLVEGALKFGGSLMIWGCMPWEGLEMLARLTGGWVGTLHQDSGG